jgi:hypothetical protein
MKKNIIKLILVTLFLIAGTTTPVLADGGGGDPPLCYPRACPPMPTGTAAPLSFNGPGFPPLCYPGEPACPIK